MAATSSGRRRNGEGSIRPYTTPSGKERWRIEWTEPADPLDPDGDTVRPGRSGFRTEEDAIETLRSILSDVAIGVVQPRTGQTTFGEVAQTWIAAKRAAPPTLAQYRRYLRLHVLPGLGDLPLAKIQPTTLAIWYNTLEQGRPGAKPIGPNSTLKAHNLISAVLQSAVDDRVLSFNAAKHPRANPPTPSQVKEAKPEVVTWTAHQLVEFLDWARANDPDHHAMFELIASTGLRRGEVVVLRWADLAFGEAKPFVSVRRALSEVKEKGAETQRLEKKVKNTKPRVVPVDPSVVQALRGHRERVGATLGTGALRQDAYVFTTKKGERLDPNGVYKRFQAAQAEWFASRAGTDPAPRISLHALRHTHASILLASGEHPKAVQERLGHETIGITMDTYSHVLPTVQESTAAHFTQMLESARSQKESEDESGFAW